MSEQAATAFADPNPAPADPPAPTPPADPAPTPGDRDWLTNDEYRAHPGLEKYSTADDLAKGYLSAQSLLGKSIRIPQQDAGDEQRQAFYEKLQAVDGVARMPSDPQDADGWDAFYNKIGRPEKPEGYSSGSDEVKALHHGLGLTDSQSSALLRAESRAETANAEANENLVKESVAKLDEVWGEGKARSLKNAQLAALQFGGQELVDAMTSDKILGNNVPLLIALAKAGEQLGNKKIPLDAAADTFNMTKEEAEQQIAELRENPAYQKGEKWAQDKMRMLHQKTYD